MKQMSSWLAKGKFNEIDAFDITRSYKPKPQNKKLSEQLKLDL